MAKDRATGLPKRLSIFRPSKLGHQPAIIICGGGYNMPETWTHEGYEMAKWFRVTASTKDRAEMPDVYSPSEVPLGAMQALHVMAGSGWSLRATGG